MKNSSPIKKLSLIASGVALSTCVLAVDRANAQTILLDFEGLKDTEQILNFYNGGTGSQGSSGINYGVSFSPNSLAIVQGAPGSNIGILPTPVTGAFFLSGSASTMNVANGFSTGFSFFYSAPFQPGVVKIYDGLNATGNLLGSINLPLTPNGASVPGCNGKNFCPFQPIGLAFNGIAKSVDFGGTVNQIVFDNITLGRNTPCVNQADCAQVKVPEPTSVMGLIAISALGAGSVLQRKLLK